MNVFDYYDPTDIGASAVLTKGNLEVSILLIECPTNTLQYDTAFEVIVHFAEIEPKPGTGWTTTGNYFGNDRAAAAKEFDLWLARYKNLGYVFKYEEQ